jgi:hypothetical protein
MRLCFKTYKCVLPHCENISSDGCPYAMCHLSYWWKLLMLSSSPIFLAVIWLHFVALHLLCICGVSLSHLSEDKFIMWTQALQHPKMWQLEALSHYVSQANPWIFFRMSVFFPFKLLHVLYRQKFHSVLCSQTSLRCIAVFQSFSSALLHQVKVSWSMVNVKSTFIAVHTLLFFLWHSCLFITCHHTTFTLHLTVIRQGWEVSRVTPLLPDVVKTIELVSLMQWSPVKHGHWGRGGVITSCWAKPHTNCLWVKCVYVNTGP